MAESSRLDTRKNTRGVVVTPPPVAEAVVETPKKVVVDVNKPIKKKRTYKRKKKEA